MLRRPVCGQIKRYSWRPKRPLIRSKSNSCWACPLGSQTTSDERSLTILGMSMLYARSMSDNLRFRRYHNTSR
jgi:hypothetical protein